MIISYMIRVKMNRVQIHTKITFYEHLFSKNRSICEALKDCKENEKNSNKGKKP